MNISQVFARCRSEQRAALIAYLMAGDPDAARSRDFVLAAVEGGADIVELGIPYSDPLADGPTIARAAERALAAGMTFDGALALMRGLQVELAGTPVIAFTYYNPVFSRGVARTAAELADAGFSGVIMPDLPPEEGGAPVAELKKRGLSATFLVTPTTPVERTSRIADLCTDFVYVVSRLGVTGADAELARGLRDLVERLRPITSKPLAVGFGISRPEQAAAVAQVADGVIVGSALINVLTGARPERAREAVRDFCAALKTGCARTR